MKNKTFLSSIRCALNGLFLALESEKNYKIYFYNILITLPINIFLDFSYIEYIIYGICIAGVFSLECLNTAIEKLCDFLTEDYDEKIKVIKDIASSGVICWGAIFYIAEIIMAGVNFFDKYPL